MRAIRCRAWTLSQGIESLVKHYEEPGHVRELTFSCYLRMPLLTNDTWREMLSRSIERAADNGLMDCEEFA